jgi:hypothetical protein
MLHCTMLHCTMLHCTMLHCTALHCTMLHYAALHCTMLHCTMLHCTMLHCTALHYAALHYAALHYAALHCTALCCTALCCTALCCTALHYAALSTLTRVLYCSYTQGYESAVLPGYLYCRALVPPGSFSYISGLCAHNTCSPLWLHWHFPLCTTQLPGYLPFVSTGAFDILVTYTAFSNGTWQERKKNAQGYCDL